MIKIFKNLAPYWKTVIVIILMLVVQAYCDLSLPGYTSDIIDTGIQNGGIVHVCPQAIKEDEFQFAETFMSDDEKSVWEEIYDKDDSIYRLNVKSESRLNELDRTLELPLIIVNQLPEEQKDSIKKMLEMQKNGDMGVKNTSLYENAQMDQLAQMSEEQRQMMQQMSADSYKDMINEIRDKAKSQIDVCGESLVKSMAVSYAQKQDQLAGVDTASLQKTYLIISGVKMTGFALLLTVAMVINTLLASRVAAGVGRDLRKSIYSKIMGFSNTEMDKFSTASLITRTTNDVQQIQMVTVLMLRMVAYAPIIGIGGIIKVVQTGSGMGWIIALAVIVILSVVGLLMVVAMPKFKLMQKLVDNVNLVSREILTGIPVIRAFGREKKEESRFDEANVELTKTTLFTSRVMTFMLPMMMFIMYGINVLIIWVAAHRIDEGTLQVGTMTAFITYAMQIVMSFLMLTMMSIMLPRAGVAANRIQEVLDEKYMISNPKNPENISEPKGIVKFDHVSFRYSGANADALEDICFTAEPGKTTAIIGSTGCGKSTLVNLIPRLYDVTGGSVTIDGHDIRNISMDDLRKEIGYVPQKGILFSGTIASNIKYGREDATDEEMREAAEIAQAVEFIDSKPEGFNSPISQGGTNVSGGQKQRLSIARAICKKPLIYVFDDSFSALDLKTDAVLRKALSEKVKDSTVIIVAQRVGTVINAEQILVMDEGKIVGRGTHKELMENCEVYRQIAYSQMSAKELGIQLGEEE